MGNSDYKFFESIKQIFVKLSGQKSDRPCKILIVGDWFVDEYWFLVRHYSDISSHVGPLHYRIYSEPSEYVKNLCGAGTVAQILYRLRNYKINDLEDFKINLKKELKKIEVDVADDVLDELENKEKDKGYFEGEGFLNILKREIVYNGIFKKLGDEILECVKEVKYKMADGCLEKIKDLDEYKKLENSNSDIIKMLKRMEEYKFEASFKLTEQSYKELEKKKLSKDILNHLRDFKDKPFIDETEFMKAINKKIESKQTIENFKSDILESANQGKKEFLGKLKRQFISKVYKEKIESIRSILESLIYKGNDVIRSYDIFGLGTWYQEDTETIRHLIHALDEEKGGYAALASFCVEPQKCKDKVDVTLKTLRPLYPTVRIIRQYNLEDNEFKQTNRIDWEPSNELLRSPKYNEEVKLCEIVNNEQKKQSSKEQVDEDDIKLKNLLSDKQIDAIVIEDYNKGLIEVKNKDNKDNKDNKGIIEELKDYSTKDTKWYIRTKHKEDELKKLLELINREIELLVLGPEVVSRSYPCETLLVNKTKITRQAFDLIKKLKKYNISGKSSQIKNIVLLSDKREVLVVLEDGKCIVGKSSKTSTQLSQVGWVSGFFASLIHEIYKKGIEEECKGKIIEKNNIENAIKNADELSGVSVPESIRLNKENKVEESADKLKPEPDVSVLRDKWADIEKKWQKALGEDPQNKEKTYGIIKENENQILEAWRVSTDLPGYVVCINEKREYIKQIWQKLREFKTAGDIKRPLAILLHADPGAGKTFLVAKLSDSIGFKFIHRDITQMIHRDDLLDLFDDIATAQAEKGSKVLVFIDEINAKLDESHVYGAFLTPIESGYYIRRGMKFKLKPCAWIFAGTKEEEEKKKEDKLKDFESRMTIRVDMDYESLKEKYEREYGTAQLEKEAQLEQVYIGAIKIRDNFPDVSKVSKAILKKFHELGPSENSYREIRKLAASLQNVQYGIVKRKNCTSYEWKERLGADYSKWLNEEESEKDFVDLILAKPSEKER